MPVPDASKLHSDIVFNITLALGMAVRAKGCRFHQGDTQLLTSSGRYYYPDVMIVCQDNGDAYLEEHPCLIVEVLSKTAEGTDRGLKLEDYRKIETLQRYVLVEQVSKLVTVYARDASGWRVDFLEHSGEIDIPCLETTLRLEQIYAGLEF
ncbi:MAG: Uma2 family endonuclease [Pleurocapsa sp. SU_196_0]|nr:Uma2 family endonuclease [Pleurocapsa sp. SU_196_0]